MPCKVCGHMFNINFLNASYMPGPVFGTGESKTNKTRTLLSSCLEYHNILREKDVKQVTIVNKSRFQSASQISWNGWSWG